MASVGELGITQDEESNMAETYYQRIARLPLHDLRLVSFAELVLKNTERESMPAFGIAQQLWSIKEYEDISPNATEEAFEQILNETPFVASIKPDEKAASPVYVHPSRLEPEKPNKTSHIKILRIFYAK